MLAHAQAMTDRVKIGQNVRVTNAQGVELRGEVTALSPTDLELETKTGTRRIAIADVWKVTKKDSNKQGFYTGTAVGFFSSWLALNQLAGYLGTTPNSEFPTAQDLPRGASTYLKVGLICGGVGAWIDSMVDGREFLYQKMERKVVVEIAPIAALGASKRLGLGGTISWR